MENVCATQVEVNKTRFNSHCCRQKVLAAHTAHPLDHLAGQADVAPLPNSALLEAKLGDAGLQGCRMQNGMQDECCLKSCCLRGLTSLCLGPK